MTQAIEEPLVGTVMEQGEWTPKEAADHVTEAWGKGVEWVVETGRRLADAKQRVEHGRWLDAVALMPFGVRQAQRLMAVAAHPDLANASHATHLPISSYTLSVLAQLPAGEVARRIEAGEITAELERSRAEEIASVYMAARQESLNRWNQAVDGLTDALSFAKTFAPPGNLPDNYVSVAEFCERLAVLNEIAAGWSE